MKHQLSPQLKKFNERVQVMNQTGGREIVLSAVDARNLHNDIFSLLAQIAELTEIKKEEEGTIGVDFDGGNF